MVRHLALEEGVFRALRREAENLKGVAREMRQGGTVTRRIGLDRDLLKMLPALRSVVEDASIRRLIHYVGSYAGEPTFQIQSVIAAAGPNSADPQTLFHADTFHPTAKAWLFLDDVAEDGGPLAYIPGSHRLTAARLDWERQQSLTARDSPDRMHAEGSFRISERDRAVLGLPVPVRMTVPANTLVVADTSGFHAPLDQPQDFPPRRDLCDVSTKPVPPLDRRASARTSAHFGPSRGDRDAPAAPVQIGRLRPRFLDYRRLCIAVRSAVSLKMSTPRTSAASSIVV